VAESVEALERRTGRLRVAVREAVLTGGKARAKTLRAELKQAETDWEAALAAAESAAGTGGTMHTERPPGDQGAAAQGVAGAGSDGTGHVAATHAQAGPLLPLREQVYEALSLLQVPAAPRLVATVHEAFFATTFPTTRVTSLRRDEERSFRTAPFARPYYICAALTADFLSPSRGLLAVSTWPMERRVIGSLSPRVDFLEAAIRVAEAIERIPAPVPAARRLLWRFATSIPGAAGSPNNVDPQAVKEAAEAELGVHKEADTRKRKAAAKRARENLSDIEQLFGSKSFRLAGKDTSA
jgi:hypothetical protein